MSQHEQASFAAQSAEAWEAFLESTELGQFQQSARWARVKALDGWRLQRVLFNNQEVSAGGLQLLWKRSRLGNIGYVSKGPVLASETPAIVDRMFMLLREEAARLRLRALILQPPDNSAITSVDLCRNGFHQGVIPSVIRATAVIDLSGGKQAVFSAMNRQVRREMRIAVRDRVSFHWGDQSDLSTFFSLMIESSRRQRSSPNPNRVELLTKLWEEFQSSARLGLARIGEVATAGLLLIAHGKRVTFWKKGWNSAGTHTFANCLVNTEAIGWACDHQFETVDFVGMNPTLATSLIAGNQLTDEQRRGRDIFNLRFGAKPKLLPPAQLLVVNPAMRQLFSAVTCVPKFERWVMRLIGGE